MRGSRADAGCGGEGFVGGVAAWGVADLGDHGHGTDAAGAGQAGEDGLVGVRSESLFDVRLERGDPFAQAAQQCDQFPGDGLGGVGRRSVGQASGCVPQVVEQSGRGAVFARV
jgi:hypothetical protein